MNTLWGILVDSFVWLNEKAGFLLSLIAAILSMTGFISCLSRKMWMDTCGYLFLSALWLSVVYMFIK
jgi:hypothetical protein